MLICDVASYLRDAGWGSFSLPAMLVIFRHSLIERGVTSQETAAVRVSTVYSCSSCFNCLQLLFVFRLFTAALRVSTVYSCSSCFDCLQLLFVFRLFTAALRVSTVYSCSSCFDCLQLLFDCIQLLFVFRLFTAAVRVSTFVSMTQAHIHLSFH
jgi:hypothetical protein